MAELTDKETLDDVLREYQACLDPDHQNTDWIDEQRLRVIRALEHEADLRAEVFRKIAEGLTKSLEKEEKALKIVK